MDVGFGQYNRVYECLSIYGRVTEVDECIGLFSPIEFGF